MSPMIPAGPLVIWPFFSLLLSRIGASAWFLVAGRLVSVVFCLWSPLYQLVPPGISSLDQFRPMLYFTAPSRPICCVPCYPSA